MALCCAASVVWFVVCVFTAPDMGPLERRVVFGCLATSAVFALLDQLGKAVL